jgi:hypothetical protein
VGIELTDLGADAAMENLFAIAAVDGRFALGAAGQEEAHETHEKTRKG